MSEPNSYCLSAASLGILDFFATDASVTFCIKTKSKDENKSKIV